MIDVEQRTLCALEQYALAGAARDIEQLPGHVHEGEDFRRDLGQLGEHRLLGELRLAEAAPQRVVVHEDAIDLGTERRRVAQILHADGAAADLVLVGGADAATGGADLAGASGFLADNVKLAVQRQDERGVLGDAQVLGADGDALRGELVDLLA